MILLMIGRAYIGKVMNRDIDIDGGLDPTTCPIFYEHPSNCDCFCLLKCHVI